jgi:hypothetical protein
LWFRGDEAERLQLRLHVAGQTDAELGIVFDFFADARARRRPADAGAFVCSIGCHAINKKMWLLPIAVFVLPTTNLYNPARQIRNGVLNSVTNGEDTGKISATTSVDAAA